MTDDKAAADLPEARSKIGRWPGLVWAVPLAALLIVLFLGVRILAQQGVDVVVTFDTASGVKVGDTKVIYQGYEVGHVVKIVLAKDLRQFDLTLRLDGRSRPALNTDTQFWMIGAKPDLTDLASVKAAVAGLAIGVAPGFKGRPTRRFKGLSDQPVIVPGTPGTGFVLTSDRLGSVKRGSTVFYHGQEIGRITATQLMGADGFRMETFILAPYDALIRPGSLFWTSAPLQLALTSRGVEGKLDNAGAVLSGAVETDLPVGAPPARSPAGARFPLYDSRTAAESGPPGPRVPYSFAFNGPGGELLKGAAVTMLGFEIGEVQTSDLVYDAHTGRPYTTVVAALNPLKLHARGPAGSRDPGAWRDASDEAVTRLLAQGFRARLVQTPPIVGRRAISLDRVKDAAPARLTPGDPPRIPSAKDSGDLDDLTTQADQILAKVNRLPIEAIGQDVRQITARLSALVASPKVGDSLTRLHSTLVQVDQITAEVKPQVGPLVTKLNQAADEATAAAAAARGLLSGEGAPKDADLPGAVRELTDAARSLRALTDYLGRHPEAVIRGKGKGGQ